MNLERAEEGTNSMAQPQSAATAPLGAIDINGRLSSAQSSASINQLFPTPPTDTIPEAQQAKAQPLSPLSPGSPLNLFKSPIRFLKSCLEDPRFADELKRSAVATAVFVCMVVLMTLAQMFSDRWFALYTRNIVYASARGTALTAADFYALGVQNGTVYATDPLFDHLSELLPDESALRGWLPDLFLSTFIGISLAVTLLLPAHTRITYQSLVVGRRILWILSLLYLFRMWSFLVTTVPNPVQNCVPKYGDDPTSYLILVGRMATGKVSACTDNIYSGHTALATVLLYSNVIYARRWYFSIYSIAHVLAIISTILLTRLHYTVDVLIALFMTSFVYCLYHFLLLIHVDGHLYRALAIDGAKIRREGSDSRFLSERRLILRLTGTNLLKMLAWMDGMDLRTSFKIVQVTRRDEPEGRQSPNASSDALFPPKTTFSENQSLNN